MKKLISTILMSLSIGAGSYANAYVIQAGGFAGTNVGIEDTLLGQATGLANSNPVTETNWVNSILNPDTTFVIKDDKVNYFATESVNVFAFQLQATPGYFLIKNARWWALYENNASADWAVVDFSKLNAGFKLPDLKSMTISHVTEFGKYTYTEVSEPSGLLITLLGLLGIGIARRRANHS